jgi:hypothetical protein
VLVISGLEHPQARWMTLRAGAEARTAWIDHRSQR